MELNERKIRILEYIINDYIASAEPVGSRTIARRHDLGLSSATIRNEMSDLEEMGYIVAPHASAGRIPSDKGYRLYVDRLLRKRANGLETELNNDEKRLLRRIISRNVNQLDYLIQETAKAISLLTNYTVVVSEAVSSQERLYYAQFMPLDETSVLLVTITASKKVKNHIIRAVSPPDHDTLLKLSRLLTAALFDKSASEITPRLVNRLKDGFLGHYTLLAAAISVINDVLNDGSDQMVYTSGIKNILMFPEFSDPDKARALFEALEERDYLIMLLETAVKDDVSVVIGHENTLLELKDCSVIKTAYSFDGQIFGGIAVIGPTRMDYSQSLAVLYGLLKTLEAPPS